MALYGEVVDKVQLTPTMVRVVLGGDGLAEYTPAQFTDQYVNVLFPPEGAPYQVPFDAEAAMAGPAEHRPRGRRYTIRSWDPEARRVTIDFVVHGDVGFAGRWATKAQPGDRLQLSGSPNGGYSPNLDAPWYLMIGDESAVPAIAASLEALRPGDDAYAVMVADGPGGEVALDSPGNVTVKWVHRDYSDADVDELIAAIDGLDVPDGTPDVFVHGEAHEVRTVRKHLIEKLGVERGGTSISPYWRRGDTDEAWRQNKREWIAAMQADI